MNHSTTGAEHIIDGILKEDPAADENATPSSFQQMSSANNITINPEIFAETKGHHPTVATFALSSQMPPKLTDALPVAERIHLALVELSDGSSIFTGCDKPGKPLQGNAHAYILPESNLGLGQRHGRRDNSHNHLCSGGLRLQRKERTGRPESGLGR